MTSTCKVRQKIICRSKQHATDSFSPQDLSPRIAIFLERLQGITKSGQNVKFFRIKTPYNSRQ